MESMRQLSPEEAKETELAKLLHAALPRINPLDLPKMSGDRSIPRKDQAKLARQLFKRFGLRGISVTTPSYSMAQSVEVRVPRRQDHVFDAHGFVVDGDAARTANNEAMARLNSLLLAAFPNHEDRSDTHTDHFDYRWSVS